MQKKLIALAIAGLSSTAFAQSNVTVSGVLKGGWDSTKVTGAGVTGNQSQISDQASAIVFSGSEALGNGLSAIFRIDARFGVDGFDNNATNSQGVGGFATGNTHVGLKSASLGEFKLGTQDLHYNEMERIEGGSKSLSQQAMVGRGILGTVNGTAIGAGASRTKNVMFWDSPNWSGFTARVAYSTNATGDELQGSVVPSATTSTTTNISTKQGKAWNLVGRYENGPIKAGVSYLTVNGDATILAPQTQAEANSTSYWGSYTIAGLTVGLAYNNSMYKGTATNAGAYGKRDGWMIPVSYQLGSHGIYATYGRVGDRTDQTGKVADSGAKQYTVGYSYDLSKRTSVGANYTKITNDSNGSYGFSNIKSFGVVTAGQDISQLYAGIRHAF